MIVPANRFEGEIEITDSEAEQQYQDNLAAYEAPARVKVDYIELKRRQPRRKRRAIGSGTQRNLRANPASATSRPRPARRATFCSALKPPPNKHSATKFSPRRKPCSPRPAPAPTLLNWPRVIPATRDPKTRGGDLGVVTRGQMVAPFEEAVFDMVADEIRGPIETRFGYHIIKLTELTEERQKTLDEARPEVAAEARRIQAENQFAELGEAFRNLVFEDPESLAHGGR